MFSKNTKDADKCTLMTALDIRDDAKNEKYLGLPVYMGRSKTKTFYYLKDRVWKQLKDGRRSSYLRQVRKC